MNPGQSPSLCLGELRAEDAKIRWLTLKPWIHSNKKGQSVHGQSLLVLAPTPLSFLSNHKKLHSSSPATHLLSIQASRCRLHTRRQCVGSWTSPGGCRSLVRFPQGVKCPSQASLPWLVSLPFSSWFGRPRGWRRDATDGPLWTGKKLSQYRWSNSSWSANAAHFLDLTVEWVSAASNCVLCLTSTTAGLR